MRAAVYLLCWVAIVAVLVSNVSSSGINTWTQLNTIDAPSQRTGASASLNGDTVVVFGGNSVSKSGSTVFLSDAYGYNLDTDTWSSLSNGVVSARAGHSAVTWNKATIIFGGQKTNVTYTNEIWQYNTGTWTSITSTGSQPTARAYHATVVVGDNMFVFGGYNGTTYLNDIYQLALGTKVWTKLAPTSSPTARLGATLVANDAGNLVLFGGSDVKSANNELWVFDVTQKTWTQQNPTTSPAARSKHSAGKVTGGFVVYGGQSGTTFLNDVWQYTYASSSWTRIASSGSSPAARGGQATVVVAGGLVVFGGSLAHGQASDAWKFVSGPILSQSGVGYLDGRTKAAAAQKDTNSVIYIFGGADSSDAALNDLITYNIATGQYATTNPTTRPAVRYNAALGIVTAGALLFGGYDGSNVFGDVWLYQVSTNNWVQHNPTSTSKPVARYGHSIIADSTTSVLLFGGISESGDYLNDLWRYNIGPQTWTRLAAAATTAPLPRAYHTAAKVSSGLLVFGGLVDGDSNAAPENDLWLFDTTSASWTQISEVGPSARYGAAIANVQGGVVVFGGADTSDNALSDAWRYDVTAEAWSQVSGISTSSRTFAVGGSTASAVVFFGGSANGAVVNSVDQLNIGGTVYVDKSGSDTTGDGSASKPFATILQAASFAPYGTIQVESGTYTGYGNINVMPNTVAQIVAHGAVIIDCANAGYGFAADASTTVLISSVAPSSFTITRCAPAVYVNGGSVTLSRVTLTNNAGATSLVSGQLQIVDSTISNNQAQSGGAVSAIAGYLILLRTTLSYNTAVQSGGAVSVASGVQFIATSLTVQHNRAATGAGIAVFGASVALQTSTFTNNTATVNGGALYVNGHAAVTLLGCTGTLNSADLGGFLYSDNSIVTLNDVTAQKSTATTGAGLYLYLSNHEITNSKVLENTATVNGGGAYFWLSTGSITSTAFTSNKAQNGAAVYADAKSEQTVASATFTSNTASLDGGAWYAKTSSATFSASTFTSNVAQRGAALFASQSAIATTGSSFTTNQASFGGAVAFYDTVAPTFATPTFTRNTATYGNFTATPVANMTVVSAPSGPQNASTILPATVIHLVDALGQIVASDSATMVTATIIANPSTRAVTPTIKGTNPQTARNGVITFNDLQVVADEGTPVSIGFSSAGLQLQSSIGFVVSACTAGQQNENGACGQCAPGSYRSADAAASCVPCPVGSYSSVSGAASCTPCAAGTFAANTGMTQCFPCTDGTWAPIGQDHCSECQMGTFSNAAVGFAQCTPCPAGTNSSIYKAAMCQSCPSGTIAPDVGSLVCTPCVAGQYNPDSSASQCKACDPGSYSNFGATQCILCPAGQYSSLPGSPQCSICGFNRVSTAPGATSCQTCDICPAGWYQTAQPGQNTCPTCTRCGPGTFTAVSSSMSCTACPRGSFSSGYAAKSCLQCPVGTFAGSPGSVTCTPCPSKSATNIKGSVQCSACPANGYSVNGTSCQACPVGATCAGNTPLNSLSGYYGGPTTFVQCFGKTNCLGGNKCATGYSGPLCSVCTNGYGRLGTLCIDCLVGYVAGAWVLGVALAIFFIIHMFIMGRDVRLAQISGQQVHPRTSSIRILMNHLQVLGWLAILKVRWSGAIQLWFFIFSAVPVMNLSNFALDCTVGLSFYQQFFFFMLLPIITLVASFLIFLIVYYIVTGRSSMKLSDLVPHYVTALIVIFRYIVPIIMLQIWQTVDCVKLDSGSYIAQDMRNACKSDTNTAAVGIGMVVFIIFIFAAPFYAFVKIMLNRKQLRYDNVTNMMAFLWLGYKEHRYFYEFFNICKNVVLIFFVLLLRRYTALQQMYSVVWLFIAVIFIFLWMRPYALPIQNVSEFFATLSQFGILITGVIYYDQGQIARPYYPIVDGFFIALNTLVILGLLVTIYWVHKMNKTFKPVLSLCSRDQKKKYEEDSDSEDDKKKSAYSLKNIRVMDEGLIPPLPPRSPRKGYGSQSDSYSYSSRSSRSSHTRSSRSRSPSIYSSDDQVRRRSRSRSNSRSASPASSRSRTDTEEAENNNKLQRRRSLSLDSRSSQEDNSSASSEFRRGQGSGRQRSASVSSSSSEESHSDSSEYGRQSRPQTGRNRSYSSSSASSDSSSDAELRRDDNPRKNRSRDSDEEPLNPTPSKGGNKNDQSYQDMNIGQLINNIEKLLGTEDD